MLLQCGSCKEELEVSGTHEPRSLPCGHSLCLGCLRVLLARNQKCPECSIVVASECSAEASFPKTLFVTALIEARERREKSVCAGNGEERELLERLQQIKAKPVELLEEDQALTAEQLAIPARAASTWELVLSDGHDEVMLAGFAAMAVPKHKTTVVVTTPPVLAVPKAVAETPELRKSPQQESKRRRNRDKKQKATETEEEEALCLAIEIAAVEKEVLAAKKKLERQLELSGMLIDAVVDGEIDVVEDILQTDPEVGSIECKTDHTFPLMAACQYGRLTVVRLLLAVESVQVNQSSSDDGATALFVASQEGFPKVTALLLEANADVSLALTSGWAPCHIAAMKGHVQILQMLIKASGGVDINAKTCDGRTALYVACENGRGDAVRLLLGAKARVNQVECDGYSPLHIAAQNGHVRVLEMLIEARAKPHLRTDDGNTAVDLALMSGQFDAVALIRDHLGKKLLHASWRGDVDAVRRLLKSGMGAHEIGKLHERDGTFALYRACDTRNAEIVRLLLNAKADVNQVRNGGQPQKGGWTALHLAAQNGHAEMLELLLKRGADTTIKTHSGLTALDVAIEHKHTAAEAVVRNHLAQTSL